MTDQERSAGDSVIDTEIDAAIDRLNGITPSDKSCEVHADSTVLLLRINKQLLRGQLAFAQGQSTLRATVISHGDRITKVEARAFEAEPSPVGMTNNFFKGAARQSSPWAFVSFAVVSIVVTIWKAKGWI
jgi:hypothetical protein